MTRLAEILTRETELVSRFILLLEKEQDALKSRRPDGLAEINQEKLSMVDQLNQIGVERSQIADLSGTTSDREKLTVWLENHPQEKKSAAQWVKLLHLAQEAKTLHQMNGALISLHLRQTSDAIAVLTQQRQSHALYGSDGQATPATGSRIVDSA